MLLFSFFPVGIEPTQVQRLIATSLCHCVTRPEQNPPLSYNPPFKKCIHGAAPSYLTNLCVPVGTNTSRRYLRSATHGDLLVSRTRMVTYGPQSFAVSGPNIWNTLRSTLRVSATTLGQCQSGLETILFSRLAYGTGHD